jgi:hypothetical protein
MTDVQIVLVLSAVACVLALLNQSTGTRRTSEKLAAWAARCRYANDPVRRARREVEWPSLGVGRSSLALIVSALSLAGYALLWSAAAWLMSGRTDLIHRGRQHSDAIAQTAVRGVSGESLLVEILSRIADERDRVLILAHVGLDISLTSLAHQFGTSHQELAARVEAILAALRGSSELVDVLGGFHQAGRDEPFQALVVRLGLQKWFCPYCGQLMIHPIVGRPRMTCSNRCRQKLRRAGQGRGELGVSGPALPWDSPGKPD